ncbi:hypothetical protein K438DRAFT_2007731 [Mycena galopus ATCC 62051]|nr:hypothetical protein K438DRAFT_2007731 [Mycena galopus ATCC 62051]
MPSLASTLVPSDILETNNPPLLESHIPFLRDLLITGRARMTTLDAKIALLQSSLDQLLAEKQELAVKIGMHEAGLSPLHCMPTEMMSHIFVFTLPPHQSDAEPASWTKTCKLQKLIMWDGLSEPPNDPTDLTCIVEAVPTLTSLVLLFSLPAEFVRDFGSRPQMAPALECILIVEDPITQKDCVHSFIQAIESHRRRLKCVEVRVPSYEELGLPPDFLERMQLLLTNEMEFDLLVNWEILWDVVPPKLQLKSVH